MIRRVVLLVALVLTLPGLTGGAPAPGPAPASAQEALLDLASVVLVPADLPVPGYGLRFGAYRTDFSSPASLNGVSGPTVSSEEALSEAGARQTYYHVLARVSEDDPGLLARAVSTVLIEFGNQAEAEAGFAGFRDSIAEDREEIPAPPQIGDEAAAFQKESSDGVGDYQLLRTLFRTGRFLVDLELRDYTGSAPTTSELVPLAETLTERLATADPSRSPGLAGQVPRLQDEAFRTELDYYLRQDGEQRALDWQTASQVQDENDYWDGIGVSDVYTYFAEIESDGTEDQPFVVLLVTLLRFHDEELAAAYIESVPQNWIANPGSGYRDVALVPDARQFGDGSAFTSHVFDLWNVGSTPGYYIWMRLGDRVAEVHVDGNPAISFTQAEQLAATQLRCLQDGGCLEPLTYPAFTPAMPADEVDPTSRTSSRDS